MKKILLILFIVLSNLSYSMTKFAQNFQERKDTLVKPVSILYAHEGYFVLDYFSGKLVYYNKDFQFEKVYDSLDRVKHVAYFDGYLYLSQSEQNNIIKINPNTGERQYYGKTGLRRGEFLHPGVIVSHDEYIYILDEHNYRIQYFDKIASNNQSLEVNEPKNHYSKSRLQTSLKVSHLGILCRLLHEHGHIINASSTELTNSLATLLELKNKEKISAASLRNKFYSPDEKSLREFKSIIKAWDDKINEILYDINYK